MNSGYTTQVVSKFLIALELRNNQINGYTNLKEEIQMVKVFISQPMKDKTDNQILAERQRAKEEVAKNFKDDEVTIIDSFFQGAPHDAKPLWFLGKSIQLLSTADVAYFVGNWREYRGCKAENYLCKEYGIKTIEE